MGFYLMMLGIIGIAGLLAVSELSGSQVGAYELLNTFENYPELKEFLRMSNKKASLAIGPIELSPEMNPLSMRLTVNKGGELGGNGSTIRYNVSLLKSNSNIVFNKSGVYTTKPKKDKKNEGRTGASGEGEEVEKFPCEVNLQPAPKISQLSY